jgi:hypothetical protein
LFPFSKNQKRFKKRGFALLPVFGEAFEVRLRVRASRAGFRSRLAEVNETAVAATPNDFGVVFEHRSVLDRFGKTAVTAFVLLFGDRDVAADRGDLIETRVIGGVEYILIRADEYVSVNGVDITIGKKAEVTV